MSGARRVGGSGALRRCCAALAALLTAGALAAGCASPRNALGTRASECFKSIPVAWHAIHGQGRFGGVRFIGARALVRFLGRLTPPVGSLPREVLEARGGLCVVSFSGRFDAWKVERGVPRGARGDRLAMVAVRASDERLLVTVLLTRSVGLTHDVA